MEEPFANVEYDGDIFFHKPHPNDEYAINPFQLERMVKNGDYKVHINFYGERVFGPPVKKEKTNK